MPPSILRRKQIVSCFIMGIIVVICTPDARADDYTDLLEILKAKGSLTSAEYNGLLAKHLRHMREAEAPARHADAGARTRLASAGRESTARGRTVHGVYHRSLPGSEAPGDTNVALAQAQAAAAQAQASATAAQQALLSTRSEMNSPSVVRVAKYVPGKGVTFKAGQIDINFSGFVNGFYTFNSPEGGMPVAGGVSTGSSGFDTSGVRNGLLPAGLLIKLSTTQDGLDLSANFGFYPGLNNANPGAFNANSGGSPVGLGTAGLDVRQVFATVGNKDIGTFKVGRDLALFGGDAILNDATLLSVGSTGSNANPANTSLGRIGVGYVYADWIPQISYISPKYHGIQATIGIFTPLDEFDYAGLNPQGNSYSALNSQHSSPMIQGKVTYDFTVGALTTRIWSSFLVQHQQHLTSASIPASANRSVNAEAGDIGTKVTLGRFEGVAYYYYGSGLGTTGLFFDGIDAAGRKRASEGYYVQGAYKILPRLKLVGSYGTSNLYQAPGENDPLLVRRNESEIGALYYNMTDWLTLVGEYAHTKSAAHNPDHDADDTMSLGAALFF